MSSPTTGRFRASISTERSAGVLGQPIDEMEEAIEELTEEVVEVFPMSGGGAGPKGRFSMAKYRSESPESAAWIA
jgi:hypothetical protein